MGAGPWGPQQNILTVGITRSCSFCHTSQYEEQQIACQGRSRSPISSRCLSHFLDRRPSLCVAMNPIASKGFQQDQAKPKRSHFYCSNFAKTDLVSLLHPTRLSPTMAASHQLPSVVSGWRSDTSPQTGGSVAPSMAPHWFSGLETSCSSEVQQVLLNRRKESIGHTYLQKWKHYNLWCNRHQLSPACSFLSTILDYLLELKRSGLSGNSIKVHLAAMTISSRGFFSLHPSYHSEIFKRSSELLPANQASYSNLGFEP